jgi:hypothetical protein
MSIELSAITFTAQANFVAESGETEMLNNGFANTLIDNDLIFGNSGTLNTDNGNA